MAGQVYTQLDVSQEGSLEEVTPLLNIKDKQTLAR